MAAEPFWSLLPDVRRGERPRFLFFAGLFTLVSFAQTLGLAGAEALFLARFGAEGLPKTLIAASATTVFFSLAYAVRVGHVRNDLLFSRMLVAAGLLVVAGAAAVRSGHALVLPALFCAWYATQAIFTNHLWTFSNDYFDNLEIKKLVPRFAVGASIGGALGGGAAAGVAAAIGPVALVAAWGGGLMGAALLLGIARPFARFGTIELEESDETSAENIVGALRFVHTSSLAGWLVVSALGMVLALFMAQYLYSDIFARSFPDPARLALFLAVYLALSNLLEIALELWVVPRLIRRRGVPGVNLLHPLLVLLSFGGLAASYTVPAGVAARAARELLENAVAAPVRSLVQNAMPARFRGKMRAFLEGIVVYAGMGVAGLVLLLVPSPDPLWLCGVGAVAALFYLHANWRVRHAYVQALLDQLKHGRIAIDDVRGALGAWEVSRLAELWEALLPGEGERPSPSLLQLVPVLAERRAVEPLARAASHPHVDVRRACVEALASIGGRGVGGYLALALDDAEPAVRLAALRGLARKGGDRRLLENRLEERLRDPDPRVRAEAALVAGDAGCELLAKMLASGSAQEARAALAVAPDELRSAVAERARAVDPEIRAAALERLAAIGRPPPPRLESVLGWLDEPAPGVRRAACRRQARFDGEPAREALVRALGDPAPEVVEEAVEGIASLGERGLVAVRPRLRDGSERVTEAALRAVGASPAPEARGILLGEQRHQVRLFCWSVLCQPFLPAGDELAPRFFRAATRDALMRSRRLAFRVLALAETPSVVDPIERALRFGSRPRRLHALDVLENLGDREVSELLVLMHREEPIEERVQGLSRLVSIPSGVRDVVDAAARSGLPWLERAARALDATGGERAPEEEEIMQQLLALKQVPLFANLSFEQLEAVQRVTHEQEYVLGETIIEEGARGDTLYLLLEGTVAVVKSHGQPNERRLRSMDAVACFGEMAVLSGEPRAATIIAESRARLLVLDGAVLRELILQMPDIAFEIFPMLTERVRRAEEAETKLRARLAGFETVGSPPRSGS